MTDTPTPAPADRTPVCPECHGPAQWGIIFTHDPTCTIGQLDAGRRMADFDRMNAEGVDYFTRVPAPHELTLAAAVGIPAGINWTLTVHRHGINANAPGGTQYGRPIGGGWVRAWNPRR